MWVEGGRNFRAKVLYHLVGLSGECSGPCVDLHFVQVRVKELFVLLHLCFSHDVVVDVNPLQSSSLR